MSDHLLLTIPEAAERLHLGRTTVYAEIAAGRLRAVKVGRARRIVVSDLKDYVARLGDGN